MPWVSKAVVGIQSWLLLSLGCLSEESSLLRIRSEGGIQAQTAARSVIYRGPVTLNYGKWKLQTAGALQGFFSRVLKRNSDHVYDVEPQLASLVAIDGVSLSFGDTVRATAPYFSWLPKRQVVRLSGKGSRVRVGESHLIAMERSSFVEFCLEGLPVFFGEWSKE